MAHFAYELCPLGVELLTARQHEIISNVLLLFAHCLAAEEVEEEEAGEAEEEDIFELEGALKLCPQHMHTSNDASMPCWVLQR